MNDRAAFKLRNIAVAGCELALAWGDGHESYIPFRRLRRACPCASCAGREVREPHTGDPPAATITSLMPVGAYAVQVVWSDGHDTGIYSFENLRGLCPCPDCSALSG